MSTIVNLSQDKDGRYYDGLQFPLEEPVWIDEPDAHWYIVYIGDEDEPMESEFDVLARHKAHAKRIAEAALERDFVRESKITSIVLA